MKITAAVSLLTAAASALCVQTPAEWLKSGREDTPVLLTVKDGAMTDLVSGASASVSGAKAERDPEMGEVLAFDGSGKGSLSLIYRGSGNVLKGKGMTLEAWVKPDSALNGEFFLFFGLGSIAFRNNCLTANWINFPTQEIYVEPEMKKKRLNYYPTSVSFHGMLPLRQGKWNHVAVVYDENGKMLRSWINGGIDRECELLRDGPQYLTLKTGGRLRAFHGIRNAKVAGLRIRAGVHHPGKAPLMKHYLNQLPWQNKMVLTLDKIDPSLPFPLEVMAILEGTKEVHTKTFSSPAKVLHMEIPMPQTWAATRPLYLKVYAGGKEVYNAMERYNNTPLPRNGSVRINPDKSISYRGVKIFPVLLYGVFAEDLKQVAELGFTTAGARDHDTAFFGIPSRNIAMRQKWNKAAIANNLYLHFNVNVFDPNVSEYVGIYRKLPKMLFWYGADEPWRDWEGLRDNYNFIRGAGGEFPVMTVQCREMHMKNTAPTCDIVGCDPYPVPNVSLRSVAALTRDASKASFGLKPVWTILGCYEPKIPNLQELRCMGIIAIANGANGLGIYSWDERTKKKPSAYHAAKRPEIVSMLKTFLSDIRSLEKILVEPNLPEVVSDPEKQPAIHASLKRADGKTYLFLANDQRREEKANLVLPDPAFTKAVPLKEFGYSGPVLNFSGGKCECTLPALAAGIFELR